MPRLLNALGFILFALGAILVGYVLYLIIAGILGWNPFGGVRPAAGWITVLVMALIASALFFLGWLFGRASVRLEWRRQMVAA